jgi:hypothetical protein
MFHPTPIPTPIYEGRDGGKYTVKHIWGGKEYWVKHTWGWTVGVGIILGKTY